MILCTLVFINRLIIYKTEKRKYFLRKIKEKQDLQKAVRDGATKEYWKDYPHLSPAKPI